MVGQEFTNYEQYEGEIIATNPETKEKIYFVAMEGNPLIVRSMFPEDVPYIVNAERKKTSSKKRKHARQLYKELEKKGLDCGAGGIACRFPADLRLQYISLSVLKHFRRKGKLPVTFWHPV